jgi:methyl-accepting chemotaxis protein
MSWFKNLNATPRLMMSFGILLVLISAVSCISISCLGKANERIGVLYQEDMLGAIHANNIAKARLSIGKQGRDAVLNIQDASIVASDEKSMLADFASLHSNLDAAEKSFYSKEGVEIITMMRNALPAYEQAYHDVYERVRAKDTTGGKVAIEAANDIGKPLNDASERAIAVKEKLAAEKFEANTQSYEAARVLVVSAATMSLVLGVILSLVIARGFSVPLGKAVDALTRMAAGDLTISMDVHTRDEVGQMATALNEAAEKLRATLQEVADTAASASASSQQLASAADAIASGAQQQAASLEETSASLEEITAAVRQSADNARQASQLACGSKDSALDSGQDATSAVAAMAEINVASAKIFDIISTVDEIAFQTNLLAVNAAVEAARAGDEGRGFAVVASEVRSLAQRSALSAKEIKGLIQDSLRKVGKGSELVNRVTHLVGEIASASGEQSSGIEQVNMAMTQMDQVTQSNAAQTEELASTAESLSDQSSRLMDLVGTFTLGNAGKDVRGGQRYSPRASNGGYAKPEVRRPGKAARSVVAVKSTSRSGGQGSRSAALVMSPGNTTDDSKFEEF